MTHSLDRSELRPLWQALHTRLSSGNPVTRIRSGPLDEAGQAALADLLGLDRMPGPRPTLTLAQLDEAVQDSCGHDARTATAAIIGPLGDHAADREQAKTERAALWRWLDAHPVVAAQPALKTWTAHMRRTGIVGASVPSTRRLLEDALRTLAVLPDEGRPLPAFAAAVLGDPHALDDDRRLAAVLLRALAALYDTTMPSCAADRRALWARAGIADDALSSTVLTAGLRPGGTGPVARSLTAYSAAAHAAHLTLAQLRAPGDLRPAPTTVHITENPSVIALALDRFGPSCPPLVCVSGWPNSAAIALLCQLADAGCRLRYHGDFDGEGLRITAYVLAKTPAEPWRMSTQDYLAAHARSATGPHPGRVTEAPWDPGLAAALLAHERAVTEEHMADILLADLAAIVSSSSS